MRGGQKRNRSQAHFLTFPHYRRGTSADDIGTSGNFGTGTHQGNHFGTEYSGPISAELCTGYERCAAIGARSHESSSTVERIAPVEAMPLPQTQPQAVSLTSSNGSYSYKSLIDLPQAGKSQDDSGKELNFAEFFLKKSQQQRTGQQPNSRGVNGILGHPYILTQALKAHQNDNEVKLKQWTDAIRLILNSDSNIGARKPIHSLPAWLTPEVVAGGYVTGKLLAGGPLLPFERDLYMELKHDACGAETPKRENGLAPLHPLTPQSPLSVPLSRGKTSSRGQRQILFNGASSECLSPVRAPGDKQEADPDPETVRAALNEYFLTDGFDLLGEMLDTQKYRISLPEEAALLVVAWLVCKRKQTEAATKLVREIRPMFSRVRFYPQPCPPSSFSDEGREEDEEEGSADDPIIQYQTVEEVCRALEDRSKQRDEKSSQRNRLMERILYTDFPLYNDALSLFLETIGEGEEVPFQVKRNDRGEKRTDVEGGWPCQRFPSDWKVRARELLDKYRQSVQAEEEAQEEMKKRNCGIWSGCDEAEGQRRNKKGRIHRELFAILETAALKSSENLSGKQVALIRSLIASSNSKRGLPGSNQLLAFQQQREKAHALSLSKDSSVYTQILLQRLQEKREQRGDRGLKSVDDVLSPVDCERDQLTQFLSPASAAVFEGKAIPSSLRKIVRGCLLGTFSQLLSRQSGEESAIVPSCEATAALLCSLGASLECLSNEAEPEDGSKPTEGQKEIGFIKKAVYRSFQSKRRSVLLFDLTSRVHVSELPWMAATRHLPALSSTTSSSSPGRSYAFSSPSLASLLNREAKKKPSPQALVARKMLKHTMKTLLLTFPETALPNKVLQEISNLLLHAKLSHHTYPHLSPIVEELAADIFQCSFTSKYATAAEKAFDFLQGTTYQRYYRLSACKEQAMISPPTSPCYGGGARKSAPSAPKILDFTRLCRLRAQARRDFTQTASWVAQNGMIVEQSQVLTSHNLVTLLSVLSFDAEEQKRSRDEEKKNWSRGRRQVELHPEDLTESKVEAEKDCFLTPEEIQNMITKCLTFICEQINVQSSAAATSAPCKSRLAPTSAAAPTSAYSSVIEEEDAEGRAFRALLRRHRKIAEAFRQMVFFLSLLEKKESTMPLFHSLRTEVIPTYWKKQKNFSMKMFPAEDENMFLRYDFAIEGLLTAMSVKKGEAEKELSSSERVLYGWVADLPAAVMD